MPEFAKTASTLRGAIAAWYRMAARDLPWRRTRDAYRVLVSETMLQQTRVATVIPYFERFTRELPTVHALAEASEARVLALWSGLGYYRRAVLLHAAARRVVRDHGGTMPQTAAGLRSLEGVGEYTAGAVASIAFGERAAVVDGNVARVLARIFAIEDDVKSARGKTRVWGVAAQLANREDDDVDAADWTQALMELGATVCVPRAPRCDACPAADVCEARARGIEENLPRASPKKKPRRVRCAAIVLASCARVLLARRRRDALYGGLWEAPILEVGAGGVGVLARALGVSGVDRVGSVVHVLSHREMAVTVARGALGARRRWAACLPSLPDYDAIEPVALAALARLPMSTLARKVLALANVPPRGLRSAAK